MPPMPTAHQIAISRSVIAQFSSWLRWALVAGAVLLPYVAVIMANAGRKRAERAEPMIILKDQRQIGARPHE